MSTLDPARRLVAKLNGDRGAVCLLILTFVALNIPLLSGAVAEQWDGKDFFAPYYHYLASLIRAGKLLGWNPFSNGGSPSFAEPQLGAASPVTLLFGLVGGPGPLGYHVYWLSVWLFGGLGMYVLARALAAPPWGALVSSLGFVLSGLYLGHAQTPCVVYNYSFAPWTIWRLRAAMLTARWQPACEAGALWGLSALAGNPAIQLPESLFLGLVTPIFALPLPPDSNARWRAARTYLVSMVLLVTVGGIVLIPSYGAFLYEVAGYSYRAKLLSEDTVLYQSCGYSWLTALLTPAFVPYGAGMLGWKDYDVAMRPLYCGAPTLVLAAFALWRRRAWREWTLFAVGLFFLGLAMGTTLPLRGWLCEWLPPMRFVRHSGTFRGFFILPVTMLAALGAARLDAAWRASDAARRLRPLAVATGIGALLGILSYAGISLVLTDDEANAVSGVAPLHMAIAWIGTLGICLAALRASAFRRWLPAALVAVTVVDLSVAFQLQRSVAFGESPSMMTVEKPRPLDDLAAAGWDRDSTSYMNENLYTRRPAFSTYTALRNLILEDWDQHAVLVGCVTGPNRVWFAAGVPPEIPATMETYVPFLRRAAALRALPIVRHERNHLLEPPPAKVPSPETLAAIAAAPAAQPMRSEILAYHANDLTLRVFAPADGCALVTERWSRSWETTVNGQAVTTDGGDYLFRLIPVRAGENVIAMRYRIAWWYVLIALSWTTLTAVAVASLWSHLRRRKPPSIPPPARPLRKMQVAEAVV